jgi:hypothetical protein
MSRNQHKNNKTPKESAQDAYIRSLYPMQVGIHNPVLRTPTQDIDDITPELLMLAQDMCILMRLYNGTGLAAPQV